MDAPEVAPGSLGEPFDSYARLLLAAGAPGDPDERQAACEELCALKHHHAHALLMVLRWLAEICPAHPLARLAELEDEVRRLRSENWELAQAVYDLQQTAEGVQQ